MKKNMDSLPKKIYQSLKSDIETGVLQPGDKLQAERELVKAYGVGRSSIREAIKLLITTGHVITETRKGTFISNAYMNSEYSNKHIKNILEIAPIHDLMEVRMFLEENFIPLAVDRATNENLNKMKMALDRIKKSGNNSNEFFKADLDFHFALAEATNNFVIIELMKIIIKRIKDNKEQFIASSAYTKDSTIATFERIIFDITNKNITEATSLYRNHIYLVDDVLKKSIDRFDIPNKETLSKDDFVGGLT